MVMMIRLTTEAPRAGWIASLFNVMPTAQAITIAATAAGSIGTPASSRKTVLMPPSMTNSPCEKFTTPEALKMMVKPSATRA